VADLNLTGKVPQPVSGGTPLTYFSWLEYTGEINGTWEQYDGSTWVSMVGSTFQTGTAYKAKFNLTAAPGYTFDGIDASPAGPKVFTYTGTGVTVTHDAGAANMPLEVTLVFPVAVNIFNLTPYLTAPVRGVPSASLTSTAQYTGTVKWFDVTDGGSEHSGLFEADTEYEAVLTLNANDPGYVFGVGPNAFTHSDADPAFSPNPSNAAGSGDEITITVRFPATAKDPSVDVEW
jgi:hypothetical protein